MGQADALEQDAAAGGLGDRELHLLVRQHPPRARGAGVVAGLHQLAVDVDAVGARPADVQAVGARDVRDHPGGGGLAVGAGHGDDRHPRPQGRGTRPRLGGPDGRGGVADQGVEVRARERVEHLGDGGPQRLGAGPVPPRVGDHDLVHVVRRADPQGEPGGPRLAGDLPDQPLDRPAGEPLPEAAAGLPGTGRPQPDPRCEPQRHRLGCVDQLGEVQGQLDRGAREVQVRSFEDPELDEGGSHPPDAIRCVRDREGQAPIAW